MTQANEKPSYLQTHAVGYCANAQLTSGSRSWASEIDYFQFSMLFHLWLLSSNQNILLVKATVGGQTSPDWIWEYSWYKIDTAVLKVLTPLRDAGHQLAIRKYYTAVLMELQWLQLILF